jgi:hypothetical protein
MDFIGYFPPLQCPPDTEGWSFLFDRAGEEHNGVVCWTEAAKPVMADMQLLITVKLGSQLESQRHDNRGFRKGLGHCQI